MVSGEARLFLIVLFVLGCAAPSTTASPEGQVLITFKSFLSNSTAFSNWDESIDVCNGDKRYWFGVTCKNNVFYGLKLENLNLTGVIDIDTLLGLPTLRSLSFMNNSFSGPLPNVKKLGALRVLYFSYNNFSGEIQEDAFEGMNSLKKVYLAENKFSGGIPSSLADLPALVELSLEGNQFQGEIPDFPKRTWTLFDLSNNDLEGSIPSSLKNTNSNSFSGNRDLCGGPLSPCNSRKKWYILAGVAAGVCVAGIIIFFVIFRLRSAKSKDSKGQKKFSTVTMGKNVGPSPHHHDTFKKSENGVLQFVRNDREKFGLEDLLSASAEILGCGSFGSSYKAVVSCGPAVVVKRFRQMSNAGREEFYEHMRRLGRLSHPNLLPLIAFYYKKEDKLLVSDYVDNGSLASHLHARPAPGQVGLDWPTRLKIIKGVARGLAHLHKELPDLAIPHGHLKSSNVLLNLNHEPILTDYALVPLVNKQHARSFMVAYKSPDYTAQHDKTSKKTDVWSLGILILELLTGKFPANYLRQGKGGENSDLAAWVNAVVREEWTGEVFDSEMKVGSKNGDGEMLKLLKIGMSCCEWKTEERMELMEAVEKIEELKEGGDSEEDYYSSYCSEVDHSKGTTEDEFSFLG